MCMSHLQMNDTRTEFITFGTPHLLSKKNLDSLTIGGTTVGCSTTRNFLCAFVDETLSFKQHVAAHASLALYRIHLMKNVRKYLTMATIKNAQVHSHTIPTGLYQVYPNKHISHYQQTL